MKEHGRYIKLMSVSAILAVSLLGLAGCSDKPHELRSCPTNDTAALVAHLGMGASCVLEQDEEGNQIIASRNGGSLDYALNNGFQDTETISSCTSVSPFVTMKQGNTVCTDGETLFVQDTSGAILGAQLLPDEAAGEQIKQLQALLGVETDTDDSPIQDNDIPQCEIDTFNNVLPPAEDQSCISEGTMYHKNDGYIASLQYEEGNEDETLQTLQEAIRRENELLQDNDSNKEITETNSRSARSTNIDPFGILALSMSGVFSGWRSIAMLQRLFSKVGASYVKSANITGDDVSRVEVYGAYNPGIFNALFPNGFWETILRKGGDYGVVGGDQYRSIKPWKTAKSRNIEKLRLELLGGNAVIGIAYLLSIIARMG